VSRHVIRVCVTKRDNVVANPEYGVARTHRCACAVQPHSASAGTGRAGSSRETVGPTDSRQSDRPRGEVRKGFRGSTVLRVGTSSSAERVPAAICYAHDHPYRLSLVFCAQAIIRRGRSYFRKCASGTASTPAFDVSEADVAGVGSATNRLPLSFLERVEFVDCLKPGIAVFRFVSSRGGRPQRDWRRNGNTICRQWSHSNPFQRVFDLSHYAIRNRIRIRL